MTGRARQTEGDVHDANEQTTHLQADLSIYASVVINEKYTLCYQERARLRQLRRPWRKKTRGEESEEMGVGRESRQELEGVALAYVTDSVT